MLIQHHGIGASPASLVAFEDPAFQVGSKPSRASLFLCCTTQQGASLLKPLQATSSNSKPNSE